MTYFALAVSLALFAWGLRRSRAMETALGAIAVARNTTAALLDARLSDAEKERAARNAAGRLLIQAGAILARFALALTAPLAFLALFVALHLVGAAAVLRTLGSWEFAAVWSGITVVVLVWRR
jgi:hypothetical protein